MSRDPRERPSSRGRRLAEQAAAEAQRARVFVVHQHEHCEGSEIVGVFRTREEAEKAALAQHPVFGPWQPLKDGDGWESGGDVVVIEEHKIA